MKRETLQPIEFVIWWIKTMATGKNRVFWVIEATMVTENYSESIFPLA